jgi:flagellar protein FliO/FliZ
MKRFGLLTACALLCCGTAYAADQPANVALDLFKVLFGLVVVLGLMAASAWLLKRFGVAKAVGGSTIKIVGGVSVGNRERVLVLEVADQWIVVGVSPGRVSSIANLPRQEQPTSVSNEPGSTNFAIWLKQMIDKRNAS